MPKYTKLTTEEVSQLPFAVHVVMDENVKTVEIEVDGIGYLVLGKWDCLEVHQQTPDEITTRWKLSGKIGKVVICEFYEDEYQAKDARGIFNLHYASILAIEEISWNETKNSPESETK